MRKGKKLKILIFIKPFAKIFPKHQHKFDTIEALKEFAEVRYWHKDGNILHILREIDMKREVVIKCKKHEK